MTLLAWPSNCRLVGLAGSDRASVTVWVPTDVEVLPGWEAVASMVCWPSCRPVKFRLAFQRPSAPDRTEVATFVPGTCTRMLELGSAVPDTSTPLASTALITSSFATLPFTVVWRVTAGAPWIVTSSVVSAVLPALSVADTTSAALVVPLAGAGGMSAAGTVTLQ